MSERDVVIVGAGPAGMSAALVLAEAGARPLVLDENPRAGGQIFRQPPPDSPSSPLPKDSTAKHGSALCKRFESNPSIEHVTSAQVWGVFGERRMAVVQEDGWQMLDARYLVLATGAHEYTPPFPGWTLPGVMTPGGAQSLVKTWNLRPGHRAVVAGTGPFLLVVARQLQSAGVEVRAVVELAHRGEFVGQAPRLLSNPGLLMEGWGYMRALRSLGIPLRWGHVVHEAHGGENGLRAVSIAPCSHEGDPDRGRTETIECDTLAIGYGFVPRIELAQLSGCELSFRDDLGGWVPVVDDDCQTSVRDVFVAGDGGGVSGSVVAELEGTLVGLVIAERMKLLGSDEVTRRKRTVLARLARLERFRQALDTVYRLRPGLARLARPETLVCRCEEISCGEVDEAGDFGAADYRTLKIMTRLGMGPCQGRMCWPSMARRLADRSGRTVAEIGPMRFRPPARPVSIGDLARELGAETPRACAASQVAGGDR